MTHLVCPLCGKSSSVERYDPSDFDNDIYIQEVHGLGRGRGFEVVDKRSIFGEDEHDHILESIKYRIQEIFTLLYEHEIISSEDSKRFLLELINSYE